MQELRTVHVTRYLSPLREGGSMPAIVEADDGFLYVLKFRGAGQGPRALIAELIGGEIARFLGFRVPELVFANLDSTFGQTEPDEEIQDLLKASTGLNLALHYLAGSITFDAGVERTEALLASKIVWLDAFLMNMDRTVKNTNMLVWHGQLWLIDHGAALYFHHNWENLTEYTARPFPLIKDHVLLSQASCLDQADAAFKEKLSKSVIESILSLVPDSWLLESDPALTTHIHRQKYVSVLERRVIDSAVFLTEAKNAKTGLV